MLGSERRARNAAAATSRAKVAGGFSPTTKVPDLTPTAAWSRRVRSVGGHAYEFDESFVLDTTKYESTFVARGLRCGRDHYDGRLVSQPKRLLHACPQKS